MSWLYPVEVWIRWLAVQVPLELFVLAGSFLEELIGPIPTTLIMTTAGTFAQLEGRTYLFLLWLAVLGAIGKTLGAWLYYVLGDKLENATMRRFGGYLGVRHEDIESIGSRFGKHHWKDGGILLILRLIPFFPSTPVSLVCGIIKIHPHIYLPATWAGNFIKDLLYVFRLCRHSLSPPSLAGCRTYALGYGHSSWRRGGRSCRLHVLAPGEGETLHRPFGGTLPLEILEINDRNEKRKARVINLTRAWGVERIRLSGARLFP